MASHRFFIMTLLLIHFLHIPSFASDKNLSKKEIILLSNEAIRDMNASNYEKSLIKARRALRYAIAVNDNNLIAGLYNTIGANFDGLAETEKAFFYYEKGLQYANKTNNDELKNWINNNLGNIYCFDKKQYEKGIFHYKKSLEYSKKSKDSAQIVFTNLNLAWAYFDIRQFEKGFPYLTLTNLYHKKHGDESTIVALKMLNGMYHNYKNNPEKAFAFFQEAIKLGIAGNQKSDLSYSYYEFSQFLFKRKDFENAYKNLELYNKTIEELDLEEKLTKANVAGIDLQIDEYKREIDKIGNDYKTKENVLLQQQSRNKKIVIVIIAILLLLLFTFYFYSQNAQLKQKNKLTDLRSKAQENTINATINGQELERKKIASFLHDNISALLSSAGMHLHAHILQNQPPSQEIIKTKAILEQAHDQVRDLSHELMPSLLAQFGLFHALIDLCEKNSNSILDFKFTCSVDQHTRYDEDFEMKIYFIIMELLNNIIKHSDAQEAKLTLKESNNSLLINIIDNGKGFDSKKFHTLEGFGINQIKARLNNLNGTIDINSKINLGTAIKISVPIVYMEQTS